MKQTINKSLRVCRILELSILLPLVFAPVCLRASELTEQQVRDAAQTWVRQVIADAEPNAVVREMEPYRVDGKIVAYIAHLQGGGFCLCGRDDLVLPVYLYNPNGTYYEEHPIYQDVLREISNRSEYFRNALKDKDTRLQIYQTSFSERAVVWQDLIAGRAPQRMKLLEGTRAEPDTMELPLTSRWRQGSPYNDQCPVLTPPDEHCVVGCTATAMSQIMYYWRWPNTGQGDDDVDYDYRWRNNWDQEPLSYDPLIPWDPVWDDRLRWTAADGGQLEMNGYWDATVFDEAYYEISLLESFRDALWDLWNRLTPETENYDADFGATIYDWSIMRDTHWDPPDAGDAEVAKLSYHAGVAVYMHYGLLGSGTSGLDSVDDALEDHFQYDNDAHHQMADGSAISSLTDEILWLRPVEMAGFIPDNGGHAFVVYGYDKSTDPDRIFLTNMGHGADWHVWYQYDHIPYSDDKEYVIRIAPENIVKFVGDDNPGDGGPGDPYEDIEEAIVEAPDGATLIFKTGSVNTFSSSPLVIDRPLTLRGYNVTIQ